MQRLNLMTLGALAIGFCGFIYDASTDYRRRMSAAAPSMRLNAPVYGVAASARGARGLRTRHAGRRRYRGLGLTGADAGRTLQARQRLASLRMRPAFQRTTMARILITSALPYINGVKHLGNLAGSMLPADVYARYCRAAGHEVLFICATDEHGTPAELAAIEAGQSVAEYCAEQHDIQKTVGAGFSLSFDWFGRSSNATQPQADAALLPTCSKTTA